MDDVTLGKVEAVQALARKNPEGALALLRQIEYDPILQPSLAANIAALVTDIGGDLRREDLVMEGIRLSERSATQMPASPHILYNIANGYSWLAKLRPKAVVSDGGSSPDGSPLLSAKHWYRCALDTKVRDADLAAQLWVNYGNCLSGLGRSIEAISAYANALALRHDHPMARGNLGVELFHFARATGHGAIALDACRMLDEALLSELLERYGGPSAAQVFGRVRSEAGSFLAEIGPVDSSPDGGTECRPGYVGTYVEFCARHQLFLNLCLGCRRCAGYCHDSLAFSLMTEISDETSHIRLSRVLNEIKERYAFARLLLYQSARPTLDTVPIDDLTQYVDNLDYAVYGTRVASIKRAYEGAYDIFDKIAHFIDSYLDLGIGAGPGLSFSTNGKVWRGKRGATLRPEITRLRNPYLYGLYDLARDFDIDWKKPENNGYWAGLRRLRNVLTHEYLMLHVEGMHWEESADREELHSTYEHFVDRTVVLLQLVRAAIIYVIGFVGLEEHKKHRQSEGLVVPVFSEPYDASLFNASLTYSTRLIR